MKLDRAIEIQDLEITCDFMGNEQDRQDAVKLSIEAMKRELLNRSGSGHIIVALLPGETKE